MTTEPNAIDPRVLAALTAMARGERPLDGLSIQSSRGGGMWPVDDLSYEAGTLRWVQRRPRGEGTLEKDAPIADDTIRAVLGLIVEGEVWKAQKPGLPVLRPGSTTILLGVALRGVGGCSVSGEENDMRHGYPPLWTALMAFNEMTTPPVPGPPRPPG